MNESEVKMWEHCSKCVSMFCCIDIKTGCLARWKSQRILPFLGKLSEKFKISDEKVVKLKKNSGYKYKTKILKLHPWKSNFALQKYCKEYFNFYAFKSTLPCNSKILNTSFANYLHSLVESLRWFSLFIYPCLATKYLLV